METKSKQKSEIWLDPRRQYPAPTGDPLAIDGMAYVELYSGNARQSCYYYMNVLGFQPLAYRGPETGCREAASYVLQQGKVKLILTTPLHSESRISHQLLVHGDTVHDLAFSVQNCEAFYYEAMRRGARSAAPPTMWEDEHGIIISAAIHTYGDVIHTLVERKDYRGAWWPGFQPYGDIMQHAPLATEVGILHIDHMVGNVELGKMNYWVNFYEQVLGFTELLHFSDKEISTEYSALMSKVMRNGSGRIKLPINEPAQGKRKSQIEEFLDFHKGPGVQHLAFATTDIIKTVSELKKRGMLFLRVPKTYYDEVPSRVGTIKEDLATISELGILVDRDDEGYLLQLFTKPVEDRPTLFFEFIQREGSQGFGVGNFKALFEAIEREQALRGNL